MHLLCFVPLLVFLLDVSFAIQTVYSQHSLNAKNILPEFTFEHNIKYHEEAIEKSENLFYGFDFLPSDFESSKILQWQRHSFPSEGIDKDPPVPFERHDLALVSKEPILSPEECKDIIEEAEQFGKYFGWVGGASRYGTPANRVGAIMPLEELSKTYSFVNFELLPRLITNICESFSCFSEHNQSTLRLGGARVVRYDSASGQVELGLHRDGLLMTCNIALNSDFEDGGTIIPAICPDTPIRLETGHALLHPGDVLHGGHPISSGTRYVLILFILDKTIVPHDRYCAERGEREMALARQIPDQKKKHLANAAAHFADAIACGARMEMNEALSKDHHDLAGEYRDLLRMAARHFGAKATS